MPARRRPNRTARGRAAHPKTLHDLIPDPANARRHTDRNLASVSDSLDHVGAARSIVIDEKGVILAGNATAAVAKDKGLKLKVIDVDGKTLVAVRRSGLSKSAKTALALYDNRSAELAEWDEDALRALQTSGFDLSGLWNEDELAKLLEHGDDDPPEVKTVEQWAVLVFCRDEREQQAFIAQMLKEKRKCRALMS